MAKVEEVVWGRSIEILGDLTPREKEAYKGGLNEINPECYIQLHPHLYDWEVYIPQTDGIKILVLTFEEYQNLSQAEVKKRLKEEKEREIGEVVECPMGCAHAAINVSDHVASLVFLKFRNDEEKPEE